MRYDSFVLLQHPVGFHISEVTFPASYSSILHEDSQHCCSILKNILIHLLCMFSNPTASLLTSGNQSCVHIYTNIWVHHSLHSDRKVTCLLYSLFFLVVFFVSWILCAATLTAISRTPLPQVQEQHISPLSSETCR